MSDINPQSWDTQIAQLQQIIADWRLYRQQVKIVRRLEMPAERTPSQELDEGYYRISAIEGYMQLLRIYASLDDELTDTQKSKIDTVQNVFQGLIKDHRFLTSGMQTRASKAVHYADAKLRSLWHTGEIYIPAGDMEHGNIIKIMKRKNSYTVTVYDVGVEAETIELQGKKEILSAICERAIRPGVDIHDVIKAHVEKRFSSHRGTAYKELVARLDSYLETELIRDVPDYRQEKENCTTCNLRLLMADIVQDKTLSDRIYGFVSDVDGTKIKDIRAALERKLAKLQAQKKSMQSGSAKPEAGDWGARTLLRREAEPSTASWSQGP